MTAANQNWILFVLNLRRTRNAAMLMEKKSSLEKKTLSANQSEWHTIFQTKMIRYHTRRSRDVCTDDWGQDSPI